jgi:branched-chain amino acid transport system ATP-binding protein
VAEPVLELRDLDVRYGGVPAVRGLSIDVGHGEVVGLVGPNGAGKSTTLLTIMGAVSPRSGDIRLGGRSIRGRRPEWICRAGVALVPEGRHVFGKLSVAENLRLGIVARRDRDRVDHDLAWLYELFPVIEESPDRRAADLSGGQQQQLSIARALLADPDLLLLDEPSLGLAPTVVERLFEALGKIRERGVAVLLVEQRAQVTVAFADRTYVIANGELRATLGPADAGDTDRLVQAYFG